MKLHIPPLPVLLFLAALALSSVPAGAALFIVDTTLVDNGDLNPGDGKCEWATFVAKRCTLRAAVQEANALAGADLIVIPDGWHIVLNRAGVGEDGAGTGDLDILENVTIGSFAPPAAWPVIDGNQIDRVFEVHWPFKLTIASLEVRGGRAPADGGGLWVHGELVSSSCRISGNSAVNYGGAVAIDLNAVASLDKCTVSGNRSGFNGTAFWNLGELTISNTTISENHDLVAGNRRDAVHNRGALRLRNTTVANHENLAIWSFDDSQAPHALVLRNVTVVGNGAGLVFEDPDSFSSPEIRNSILANNDGDFLGYDCYVDAGAANIQNNNNLDSDGSCGLAGAGSDLPGTDPMLGVLQLNGGTTRTMVPKVGSPVIEAGNSGCEPADQRGASRPLDGDGVGGSDCDIGAVEVLPCTGTPNLAVSSVVASSPVTYEACFTIAAGPAVDIYAGGKMTFRARDSVVFRNGFTVHAGGEVVVIRDPAAGSGMALP